MSVIFGTTNTDGTGTSANLTTDNGTELAVSGREYYYDDGYHGSSWYVASGDVEMTYDVNHSGSVTLKIENEGEWNSSEAKELYIDSVSMSHAFNGQHMQMTIDNFVDVTIILDDVLVGDNESYSRNVININDAKRGYIDTSDVYFEGGLTLEISPSSNGSSWSNLFEITTGDSSEDVTFNNDSGTGTQWTEFKVDLGGGSDSFTYQLESAASTSQTRYVDGGEGDDTLVLLTDSEDLDFVNFEYIENGSNTQDYTLTLSEEILANNSSGLTITDLNIEFSDDYESIEVESELDESGEETGYYDVTVIYDDATYSIVTNEIDDTWLLAS